MIIPAYLLLLSPPPRPNAPHRPPIAAALCQVHTVPMLLPSPTTHSPTHCFPHHCRCFALRWQVHTVIIPAYLPFITPAIVLQHYEGSLHNIAKLYIVISTILTFQVRGRSGFSTGWSGARTFWGYQSNAHSLGEGSLVRISGAAAGYTIWPALLCLAPHASTPPTRTCPLPRNPISPFTPRKHSLQSPPHPPSLSIAPRPPPPPPRTHVSPRPTPLTTLQSTACTSTSPSFPPPVSATAHPHPCDRPRPAPTLQEYSLYFAEFIFCLRPEDIAVTTRFTAGNRALREWYSMQVRDARIDSARRAGT